MTDRARPLEDEPPAALACVGVWSDAGANGPWGRRSRFFGSARCGLARRRSAPAPSFGRPAAKRAPAGSTGGAGSASPGRAEPASGRRLMGSASDHPRLPTGPPGISELRGGGRRGETCVGGPRCGDALRAQARGRADGRGDRIAGGRRRAGAGRRPGLRAADGSRCPRSRRPIVLWLGRALARLRLRLGIAAAAVFAIVRRAASAGLRVAWLRALAWLRVVAWLCTRAWLRAVAWPGVVAGLLVLALGLAILGLTAVGLLVSGWLVLVVGLRRVGRIDRLGRGRRRRVLRRAGGRGWNRGGRRAGGWRRSRGGRRAVGWWRGRSGKSGVRVRGVCGIRFRGLSRGRVRGIVRACFDRSEREDRRLGEGPFGVVACRRARGGRGVSGRAQHDERRADC
jgi:hypothetical protein